MFYINGIVWVNCRNSYTHIYIYILGVRQWVRYTIRVSISQSKSKSATFPSLLFHVYLRPTYICRIYGFRGHRITYGQIIISSSASPSSPSPVKPLTKERENGYGSVDVVDLKNDMCSIYEMGTIGNDDFGIKCVHIEQPVSHMCVCVCVCELVLVLRLWSNTVWANSN